MFAILLLAAVSVEIRVEPSGHILPAMKRLVAVEASKPGPDAAGFQAAAETSEIGRPLKPSGAGPFDVYWQPVEGRAILIAVGNKGGTLKLDDAIGIVRIRGDRLAKPALLALADPGSLGPDEPEFRPVQTTTALRRDLVVPAGDYSLWFKPATGGKAVLLEKKLRVVPGRVLEIE